MKMSNNPAKYEVLIKQYLRSILDISGVVWRKTFRPFSNFPGVVHWRLRFFQSVLFKLMAFLWSAIYDKIIITQTLGTTQIFVGDQSYTDPNKKIGFIEPIVVFKKFKVHLFTLIQLQ